MSFFRSILFVLVITLTACTGLHYRSPSGNLQADGYMRPLSAPATIAAAERFQSAEVGASQCEEVVELVKAGTINSARCDVGGNHLCICRAQPCECNGWYGSGYGGNGYAPNSLLVSGMMAATDYARAQATPVSSPASGVPVSSDVAAIMADFQAQIDELGGIVFALPAR